MKKLLLIFALLFCTFTFAQKVSLLNNKTHFFLKVYENKELKKIHIYKNGIIVNKFNPKEESFTIKIDNPKGYAFSHRLENNIVCIYFSSEKERQNDGFMSYLEEVNGDNERQMEFF